MTVTIYGIAKSRAFRTLWMAEELGLAYRHEQIDFSDESLRGKAFRAINPMMQIPALEDGGVVFTESLAINIYLAEKHGGDLAPRDASERGQVAMWSLFAATQLEKPALDVFYNRHLKPENERDHTLAKTQLEALQRPLHFMDGALQRNGGTLMEGRIICSRHQRSLLPVLPAQGYGPVCGAPASGGMVGSHDKTASLSESHGAAR